MVKYLPNLLSGLRLAAAPLTAWAIFAGHDMGALALFIAAAFSDLMDGFLARRWGLTSRLGAGLDPVADKLLIILCLAALADAGAAPFWLMGLVVACDVMLLAGAVLAWGLSLPLRFAAQIMGKASMLVLVGYVAGALLLLSLDLSAPRVLLAAGYTAALFVLLAATGYAQLFFRALFSGQRTA